MTVSLGIFRGTSTARLDDLKVPDGTLMYIRDSARVTIYGVEYTAGDWCFTHGRWERLTDTVPSLAVDPPRAKGAWLRPWRKIKAQQEGKS